VWWVGGGGGGVGGGGGGGGGCRVGVISDTVGGVLASFFTIKNIFLFNFSNQRPSSPVIKDLKPGK